MVIALGQLLESNLQPADLLGGSLGSTARLRVFVDIQTGLTLFFFLLIPKIVEQPGHFLPVLFDLLLHVVDRNGHPLLGFSESFFPMAAHLRLGFFAWLRG